VVHSLAPPAGLSDSIARAVQQAIDAIPPDKHGALVGIVTERGTNLVVVGRSSSGAVQAQAWIGKSGWDTPIREGWEAGGQIAVIF
jgi:hypothetical protein